MRKTAKYVKTTLFDSSLAHFRVTLETRLTRLRPDNSVENLCYIDNFNNANINPSIYLVFNYRGETREDSKALYMSYPQLFKLRSVMEEVKDKLISDDTFSAEEGVLEVKPQYKEPIVYANIGKDKKWLSFSLGVMSNEGEDGLQRERGVIIQISGSDLSSVLSMDEFLTVYTIVKDLDLASIQIMTGYFALLNDDSPAMMAQGGYQQPYGGYQNNGYQSGGYQQGGYAPRAPQAPRYQGGNTGYQRSAQGSGYSRSYNGAPQAPAQQGGYAPRSASYQQAAPQAQSAPQAQQMPPRGAAAPIVSAQAVAETPVEHTTWDDEDLSLEIFGDNN